MSTVINESVTLVVKVCGKCGITFAIPELFDRENWEAGPKRSWYCPNGHSRVYTESKNAKLEQALQRERQRADQAEADARYAREDAKRTATVFKGKMTKLRNRVGNGVCPCCNRSFRNLMDHMKSQHPDFTKPEAASV